MDYRIMHIPIVSKKRPGTKTTMKYITIHSTANPSSTAINERNWLINLSNDRAASWHIAVDDNMAVEAIPLNEVAYHAGDSTGNKTSIGLEICESGDRIQTISNAARVTAKLLYDRNWGTDKLRRHYDWSGKICPRIFSANNWKSWVGFKNQVRRELEVLTINNRDGLQDVKVSLKGELLTFRGIFKNNIHYISIREFAETLGYEVEWDRERQIILIK